MGLKESECSFINLYYKTKLLFTPEYYYILLPLEDLPRRTNYEQDISWFNGWVASNWIVCRMFPQELEVTMCAPSLFLCLMLRWELSALVDGYLPSIHSWPIYFPLWWTDSMLVTCAHSIRLMSILEDLGFILNYVDFAYLCYDFYICVDFVV